MAGDDGFIYYTNCSSTSCTTAWTNWTAKSTVMTATTNMWSSWCDDDTSVAVGTWSYWSNTATYTSAIKTAKAKPKTAEELAEAARLAAVRAQEEKEAKEAQKRATVRARELLVSFLDKQQQEELEKNNRFYLIGKDGVRYEIDTTRRMHNVFEVDENGKRFVEHCVYADAHVPLFDNALAQKLLLEANPSELKRIANQRTLAPRPAQRAAA